MSRAAFRPTRGGRSYGRRRARARSGPDSRRRPDRCGGARMRSVPGTPARGAAARRCGAGARGTKRESRGPRRGRPRSDAEAARGWARNRAARAPGSRAGSSSRSPPSSCSRRRLVRRRPADLRAQDQRAQVPHRTPSRRHLRDPADFAEHLRSRVDRRAGECRHPQRGQVVHVVPHVGGLGERDREIRAHPCKGRALLAGRSHHRRNGELAAAALHQIGAAAGDHRDPDRTRRDEEAEGMPVPDVERLQHLAVLAIIEAPVRHRPVDVEDQQAETAQQGLAGRLGHYRTERMASTSRMVASHIGNESEFGPSESALSGSSWTSQKSASIPTAAAARARGGASVRSPPVRSPCPPGLCTEWVASKQTGANSRIWMIPRKSTTRSWYPKLAPRSVRSTFLHPASASFATAFFMSEGATNCPFLTLTARPVRPAAWSRSVWRQRNAGICNTSTTSATGAHCASSWTSVSTGSPVSLRTRPRILSPSTRPGPRNDRWLVRFALSNEHLKTAGNPAFCEASAPLRGAARVCASPSMTQGPAMTRSGSPGPTAMSPILTPAPSGRPRAADPPRVDAAPPRLPVLSRPGAPWPPGRTPRRAGGGRTACSGTPDGTGSRGTRDARKARGSRPARVARSLRSR